MFLEEVDEDVFGSWKGMKGVDIVNDGFTVTIREEGILTELKKCMDEGRDG